MTKKTTDFSANTFTPEIKTDKTPVDMILEKASTMQPKDFLSWIAIHATDLKQREINLLADSYFEGLSEEPLDRVKQTEYYIVEKYKHLPTIED